MAKPKNIEIKISKTLCKSCEICVEFCPHDVLEMYEGLAHVKNLAACTACGLCEMYCPDFAIQVNVNPEEKENSEK